MARNEKGGRLGCRTRSSMPSKLVATTLGRRAWNAGSSPTLFPAAGNSSISVEVALRHAAAVFSGTSAAGRSESR